MKVTNVKRPKIKLFRKAIMAGLLVATIGLTGSFTLDGWAKKTIGRDADAMDMLNKLLTNSEDVKAKENYVEKESRKSKKYFSVKRIEKDEDGKIIATFIGGSKMELKKSNYASIMYLISEKYTNEKKGEKQLEMKYERSINDEYLKAVKNKKEKTSLVAEQTIKRHDLISIDFKKDKAVVGYSCGGSKEIVGEDIVHYYNLLVGEYFFDIADKTEIRNINDGQEAMFDCTDRLSITVEQKKEFLEEKKKVNTH